MVVPLAVLKWRRSSLATTHTPLIVVATRNQQHHATALVLEYNVTEGRDLREKSSKVQQQTRRNGETR